MPKPMNLGAVAPINTLSNNHTASRPPFGFQSSPRSSSRAPPSSPPFPKRQKLDDDNESPVIEHSQAIFTLADSNGESRTLRKRSIESESITGSQRSTGSNKTVTGAAIVEYRQVDRFTKPPRKRLRTKSSEHKIPSKPEIESPGPNLSPMRTEDEDEIEDEILLVNHHPKASSSCSRPVQKRKLDGEGDIMHYAKVYKKRAAYPARSEPAKQGFSKIIDKVEGKADHEEPDESPDELASSTEGNTKKQLEYRRGLAPSLSKRGNIQPTDFKSATAAQPPLAMDADSRQIKDRLDNAGSIIGSGLRIVRGVSGQCQYRADYDGDPDDCFLSIRALSHTLFPVDQDREHLRPYGYLTVNLANVRHIVHAMDENSCIVSVNSNSADLANGAGPKLMLEFASLPACRKFLQWVGVYMANGTKFKIDTGPKTKLEREFREMAKRAPNHKVIRDDGNKSTIGDDIKVIQHNREVKMQRSSDCHAHVVEQNQHMANESRPRPKLKDVMDSSATSRAGDADIASSQALDDQRPSAPQRTGTTRSKFALLDSSEPGEPEPQSWTTLNPGWEKSWRNSLVYPPEGKNRATVDKDDIPRLDEGQFLNDNIIIFYLRFLQQQLEADQPDLARRIYFHNTFFYDKLKPTKSGQGINYDSVKGWTSKVDLFSKDYIVVPINEHQHWYIAIICNAPKLIPPSDGLEQADQDKKNVIAIPDDTEDDKKQSTAPLQSGITNGFTDDQRVALAAQDDVTEKMRRISIDGDSYPSSENGEKREEQAVAHVDLAPVMDDHVVHVIKDSDRSDAGGNDNATAVNSPSPRKSAKRKSIARKNDPTLPRIITLDSLGQSHSPTCIFLKHYLIAELKDKKGITIPGPGSIGITAKGIPEQTNHCDCGVFLLGYIQQFLSAPDAFFKSFVQRDSGVIPWRLDPSELRNSIRELIFSLQRKQQQCEDEDRERKRKARLNKPQTSTGAPSHASAAVESHPRRSPKQDLSSQDGRNDKASGSEVSSTGPSSRPSSSRGSTTINGETTDRSHWITSGGNTKDAITTNQPSASRVGFDGLTSSEPAEVVDRQSVAVVQDRSKTNSPVVVSPHKTEGSADHKTRHQIPGAFPVSPVEAEGVRGRSPSPPPPSSKSSRGAIPLEPVVVGGSRENGQDATSQGFSATRSIIVELPSKRAHSRHLSEEGKTGGRKHTGQQSAYFGDRQEGERVTFAKLRVTPRQDYIDLSDD